MSLRPRLPALQEIYNAEDRDHPEKAVRDFEGVNGAKWPKAVKKITGEVDELLAFYDLPAEHWVHLRTTNPTAPHLVALVRNGACFKNGHLVERPEATAA